LSIIETKIILHLIKKSLILNQPLLSLEITILGQIFEQFILMSIFFLDYLQIIQLGFRLGDCFCCGQRFQRFRKQKEIKGVEFLIRGFYREGEQLDRVEYVQEY
jgi:hypothetical protein